MCIREVVASDMAEFIVSNGFTRYIPLLAITVRPF